MSTLISSAVGAGKKAAPKAVGRRRPPPLPTKAAPAAVVPTEDHHDAPASPLSTRGEVNETESASAQRGSPPPTVQSTEQPVNDSTIPVSGISSAARSSAQPPETVIQDASQSRQQPPGERIDANDSAASQVNVESSVTERAASPASKKRLHVDVANEDTITSAKRIKTTRGATSRTSDGVEPSVRPSRSTSSSTSHENRDRPSENHNIDSSARLAHQTTRRQTRGSNIPPTTRSTRSSAARAASEVDGVETENLESSTQNIGQDEPATTQPESQSVQPARNPRRRGRVRGAQPSDNATNEANDSNEAAQQDSSAKSRESYEVDPSTLSMYEMSRDSKHGKISEREKKMAEIDWDEVARKRREHDDEAAANLQAKKKVIVESTEGPEGVAPPQPEDTTPALSGGAGVKFRIVDNLIVVDETTTTIDRQARAEAEAQTSGPVQEETDLTARINRTTWINDRRRDLADRVPMYRNKSDPWSFEETERLYEAITMFGTDYFTIAQMFPPKTRKQIKLKVQREEKLDPQRINAAFMGTHTPMNLEFYAHATGRDLSDFTKYGNLEQAASRIADDMKDKEEAMHAALAQEAENEKNREAFEKEQARVKGSRKKGAGERKTKKKLHTGGTMGGGVPVEPVSETIEQDD